MPHLRCPTCAAPAGAGQGAGAAPGSRHHPPHLPALPAADERRQQAAVRCACCGLLGHRGRLPAGLEQPLAHGPALPDLRPGKRLPPCWGHAAAMLGHAGAMLPPCWGHTAAMLGHVAAATQPALRLNRTGQAAACQCSTCSVPRALLHAAAVPTAAAAMPASAPACCSAGAVQRLESMWSVWSAWQMKPCRPPPPRRGECAGLQARC